MRYTLYLETTLTGGASETKTCTINLGTVLPKLLDDRKFMLSSYVLMTNQSVNSTGVKISLENSNQYNTNDPPTQKMVLGFCLPSGGGVGNYNYEYTEKSCLKRMIHYPLQNSLKFSFDSIDSTVLSTSSIFICLNFDLIPLRLD